MINEILDDALDKGQFYGHFATATKIKTLYGTSFLEAIPYYDSITEKVVEPEVIMGVQVGTRVVEREVPRLRFRIRAMGPWEVYVDPFARALEEKGGCHYIIKIDLIRKEEILRMARGGAYPGIDIEMLMADNELGKGNKADNWGLNMLADIGLTDPNNDDGIGVLMRFESESRYIDLWNGQIVLRDIPNPYKHKMINLSRYIHTQDAHTQNQFWGVGEAKPNEILCAMLDDQWNMTFDNHNMQNQGITYYANGVVNPDALVRTVGNKIGIDVAEGDDIKKYVQESFGQPMPQDFYAIPQSIERLIDLSSGLFELQRGEQSQSDRTATESAMRKEYGDSRQELNVRLGEMVCLKSFGEKMLMHLDQFATTDDVIEVVGEQGAQLLQGLNPADLPGGYNFQFKGADRVANLLTKQRNWKELLPLMLQIPNVQPGKLARKMLEIFEEDDVSAEEIIIPDEMVQQMGQQQKEQEIIEVEQEKQRDHARDVELALIDGEIKQRQQTAKARDNKNKSTGKGAVHSKNQPKHDTKSEAQNQARVQRGEG